MSAMSTTENLAGLALDNSHELYSRKNGLLTQKRDGLSVPLNWNASHHNCAFLVSLHSKLLMVAQRFRKIFSFARPEAQALVDVKRIKHRAKRECFRASLTRNIHPVANENRADPSPPEFFLDHNIFQNRDIGVDKFHLGETDDLPANFGNPRISRNRPPQTIAYIRLANQSVDFTLVATVGSDDSKSVH